MNSDVAVGPGIDASCDIVLDGLPFNDEEFDYISSQHALQQLRVADIMAALRELHRVLKPGGVLRLCLPDFDAAIEAYRERRQEALLCWDWHSVSGNFITQITDYNYTKTPLTYEFTAELLCRAGFAFVLRGEYQETGSNHPEIVALDSRPAESFYIEAFKEGPAASEKDVAAGNAISGIHVSWTDEPSSSLTAVWSTRACPPASWLEWREVGVRAWHRVEATARVVPGGRVAHRADLHGLAPATLYEYRVTSAQEACVSVSKVYRTQTAPAPGPADFRFAFVCDTGIAGRRDGNANGVEQVIKEIAAEQALFLLGGGDYAYADRDRRYANAADAVDAWFEQMQHLLARVPFMAQYGNHEVFLGERFRDWAPRFAHPDSLREGRNYSFRVGDAHFTALYVPGPDITPEQVVWLDADLQRARDAGAHWLIIYQHEPIYGHGRSHPADPRVRAALAPVFEKHRVDLHLSGHDQNYERTYPLRGVPDAPTVASFSPDLYEARCGVVYAKVSPGGKMSDKRNDFSRFVAARPDFIAVRDDTAHHYALVTVRGRSEIVVNVYGVVGDRTPKYLLDSFRIVAASAERSK